MCSFLDNFIENNASIKSLLSTPRVYRELSNFKSRTIWNQELLMKLHVNQVQLGKKSWVVDSITFAVYNNASSTVVFERKKTDDATSL